MRRKIKTKKDRLDTSCRCWTTDEEGTYQFRRRERRSLFRGIAWIVAFVIWTALIRHVDVQLVGQRGTAIGFATFNSWFHQLTGVHMTLYTITDWLGLVPIGVCLLFAGMGLGQWIKRKDLRKVDKNLIVLGVYYVIVILCYLMFEMIPVNYRPVLIGGRLEASYPSSTTLLVLSVMPTLAYQMLYRTKCSSRQKIIDICASIFSGFMVIGRLLSGVHWFTDIVGAILLSTGLFLLYRAGAEKVKKNIGDQHGIS